jgi:hypothetical protein
MGVRGVNLRSQETVVHLLTLPDLQHNWPSHLDATVVDFLLESSPR